MFLRLMELIVVLRASWLLIMLLGLAGRGANRQYAKWDGSRLMDSLRSAPGTHIRLDVGG
jgi:hypothetical protein